MPKLRNLITPELEPDRLCHSEAVDVEDSAAHAELRDVVDHLNALEANRLEMRGEIFGTPHVALSQLETRVRKRAG